MGVAGTAPVQTLSLPRLIIRPEALASISKTMRPGVADTNSFCLRGMPAARRSSRESTIRLEASSVTVVFMPLVWRGHGVFARAGNDVRRVTYKWRELAESEKLATEHRKLIIQMWHELNEVFGKNIEI